MTKRAPDVNPFKARPQSSSGERSVDGPASQDADQQGSIPAVIDLLEAAALSAVDVMNEAVSIAAICSANQHCSVSLSLCLDQTTSNRDEIELLAQEVNGGEQRALSALRRLGEHQSMAASKIAEAAAMLARMNENSNHLKEVERSAEYQAMNESAQIIYDIVSEISKGARGANR